MARACDPGGRHARVVSLEQHRQRRRTPLLRLSPEYDGMELLYANDRHPDKLFALKILAWGLRPNASVVALIPWLDDLVVAEELADPLNGRWEGFRFAGDDHVFTDPPDYKVRELDFAARYFGSHRQAPVPQEIPDTIGTHVVFADRTFQSLRLQEVVSWRLDHDGRMQALVPDEAQVSRTPVLPGDPCLVPAAEEPGFRYYFQYGIANRIKERDPETLAAIAMLGEDL